MGRESCLHSQPENDESMNDTLKVNQKRASKRMNKDIASDEPFKRHESARTETAESINSTYQQKNTKDDIQAVRPLDDKDFVWPSFSEIVATQNSCKTERPRSAKGNCDDGWYVSNRLWLPPSANLLIQRIMVVAHCGAQGHRGRAATIESIRRYFFLDHLEACVQLLLSACLLCHHVKGGKIIPRPWAATHRCHERNGALHWDFVALGDSFAGDKYLLVLKDEATHFCELLPCVSPTSMVAVEAILAWHSRYGIPPLWISDQGSHFKNQVVDDVCRRMKSRQEFTVAYSPWLNGSIERLNRDLLQVLRVFCLEYRVDTHDWSYSVPMLQANLNHTPVPSLHNKAPIELFCGLPIPSPLRFCVDLKRRQIVEMTDPPEQIQQKIDSLLESLRQMHKDVRVEREKQTKRNQRNQRHSRKPNFDIGEYVLRSRIDQKHQNKLLATWIGPYRVIRADEHSFAVKHLTTGAEMDVHPSRLKFYTDKDFEVTEEIRDHVGTLGEILAVKALKDNRWNDAKGDYDVLVSWKGLESIEDSWESWKSLNTSIPVMLKQYADQCGDSQFINYATTTTTEATQKSHGQAKPKNNARAKKRTKNVRRAQE
jgi:hypothetical protein